MIQKAACFFLFSAETQLTDNIENLLSYFRDRDIHVRANGDLVIDVLVCLGVFVGNGARANNSDSQ